MILKVLVFYNFTGKKKKVIMLRKTKKGLNGKIGKTWMQCGSLTDWTNILVNRFFAFLKSSFGCMTKKQHVEIESLSLGIKLQFCPSLWSSVAGLSTQEKRLTVFFIIFASNRVKFGFPKTIFSNTRLFARSHHTIRRGVRTEISTKNEKRRKTKCGLNVT